MRASATSAALLAAVALAGCGEKDEPDVTRPVAVTGTLDLEREAGPPDAGTATGHRAPFTATTRRTALAFGGRVTPPSSRVRLSRRGAEPATVRVGAGGRFRARARGLRRGENRFVLEGTAPGLRPWRVDVAITRR